MAWCKVNAVMFIVHKFGGTSVKGESRMRALLEIIKSWPKNPSSFLVVSAMGGATDKLIALLELAKTQDPSLKDQLSALISWHGETLCSLSPDSASRQNLLKKFTQDAQDLSDLLKAVSLGKNYSESTLELVSGYGELWSAQILSHFFNEQGIPSNFIDARQIITVTHTESGPVVDWPRSTQAMQSTIKSNPNSLGIMTGYVASTPEGIPTTLKRNGSDFSAAIAGALLKAQEIVIWTDVDGVLSADPRRVPDAVIVPELSYEEAMELAYFGAKVLHPQTMGPAVREQIPIRIKNSFNPSAAGSVIKTKVTHSNIVSGFSTIDQISLLNIEGSGMIGVPGIASRAFGALRNNGISVIMISQASSEQSICLAVPLIQGNKAQTAIAQEFAAEISAGKIQNVTQNPNCAILAAVGDNMAQTPGVAARFFSALAKSQINIKAIAQGSTERNISVVISKDQSVRALRSVHSAFYLSPQTLSVALVGPGSIGKHLMEQISNRKAWLKSEFNVDLRLRAVINSKKMCLAEDLDMAQWQKTFDQSNTTPDFENLINHIQSDHIPHSLVIDCSSSAQVAERYSSWLDRGVHVITPNKKANSSSFEQYQKIQSSARKHRSRYFYEATVGAGLPVITTLKDLILTGDQILEIEGVFSGTLSYLFGTFDGTKPYSNIVNQAKTLGYTEPDPRDDLSGTDVARKLIILAREAGFPIEMNQVQVESLVPSELQKCPDAESYLKRLPEFDLQMQQRWQQAHSKGEVLRYVGSLNSAGASVSLKTYPSSHPFANLLPADNIFLFRTKRYQKNPLVVQGPGAGPDVTAAGVFADLLRLSSYLGAAL